MWLALASARTVHTVTDRIWKIAAPGFRNPERVWGHDPCDGTHGPDHHTLGSPRLPHPPAPIRASFSGSCSRCIAGARTMKRPGRRTPGPSASPALHVESRMAQASGAGSLARSVAARFSRLARRIARCHSLERQATEQ